MSSSGQDDDHGSSTGGSKKARTDQQEQSLAMPPHQRLLPPLLPAIYNPALGQVQYQPFLVPPAYNLNQNLVAVPQYVLEQMQQRLQSSMAIAQNNQEMLSSFHQIISNRDATIARLEKEVKTLKRQKQQQEQQANKDSSSSALTTTTAANKKKRKIINVRRRRYRIYPQPIPTGVIRNVMDFISDRNTWDTVVTSVGIDVARASKTARPPTWPNNRRLCKPTKFAWMTGMFTPDSQWFLEVFRYGEKYSSDDFLRLRIWNIRFGRSGTVTIGSFKNGVLSKDCRLLAAFNGFGSKQNNIIRLFGVRGLSTGKRPHINRKQYLDLIIDEPVEKINIVSFTPDANLLVALYTNQEWEDTISVWSIRDSNRHPIKQYTGAGVDLDYYGICIDQFLFEDKYIFWHNYDGWFLWNHDEDHPIVVDREGENMIDHRFLDSRFEATSAKSNPKDSSLVAYVCRDLHLYIEPVTEEDEEVPPGLDPDRDCADIALLRIEQNDAKGIGEEANNVDSMVFPPWFSLEQRQTQRFFQRIQWFPDGLHLALTTRQYLQIYQVNCEDGTICKVGCASALGILMSKVNVYMSFQGDQVTLDGFEISPDGMNVAIEVGNEIESTSHFRLFALDIVS